MMLCFSDLVTAVVTAGNAVVTAGGRDAPGPVPEGLVHVKGLADPDLAPEVLGQRDQVQDLIGESSMDWTSWRFNKHDKLNLGAYFRY